MTLNGLYVFAWVAVIIGAVVFIPRAIAHDRLMFMLDNLDDEELAAMEAEFPDLLARWRA